MDTEQIIKTFIGYFEERGHRRVTGTSLVPPPGDPVLFTTSGMHPLIPYLEGRPHPLGRRLVNVQRCLRTTDLDEVGDSTHLTVFEMLGSWSLGDYDHPQSLRWGYELLRDGFGIGPDRLYATVFGGDGQVGPDTGAIDTWRELGVPVELTGDENWWSNGPTGPSGPDSEMFVWTGDTHPRGTPGTDPHWVEVWNHVGMRYHRHGDGSLTPLVQSNVDTGMGLERLVTVLQNKPSVYESDLFAPLMGTVSGLWTPDQPDQPDQQSRRLIVDHLRSVIVIIGDGIRPSNTGRGYVLRRLIRRMLTTLWRDDPTRTLSDLPDEPVERTLAHFQQPVDPQRVRDVLIDEERRFRALVERGRGVIERHLSRRGSGEPLTDDDYEYLHDTHGLPRDLVDSLLPSFVEDGAAAPTIR